MPHEQPEQLITIQVTPGELIAVGHLIYTYRLRLKSVPDPTPEQRELLKLLESFQRRVAIPTRTALDLSATPEPWQKNDALPLFSPNVSILDNHISRWPGQASQRLVALLKSFFRMLKKDLEKGRRKDS
jgi:hypothetical protein